MRTRVLVALAATLAICMLAGASTAAAGSFKTPDRHHPHWYTAKFKKKLHKRGAKGIRLSNEQMNTACPGYAAKGVGANGCIIAPNGCTANFIFTDGTSKYIGTAHHCIDPNEDLGNDVGRRLVMQVDTTTVAEVGSVVAHTTDEVPGNDFALVKIDADVAAKWGVNPAIPFIGGPNGVYSGCGPEAIKYYGHGYVVAVGPGKPGGGLATNWNDDGFGWTGTGLPGDSGSGVVTSTGQAAGDLTHLLVDIGGYPGSNMAGMRATAFMHFLGSGYQLVNADGSTSSAPTTNCGPSGLGL
ncbi:MAG: hypothetical protein QOJ07_411 [Thermoleophilaceae bacterium]|jgi:hypothetical protein|nr:hypothetical protein [Thermoleophilaceae bacterium]